MSRIRTRFAPSPTGYIHIGNARTALICYLYAKKMDGEFLLRIDDTDLERSEEKYVEAIKEDLEWLGLKWDKTFRQSERLERYEEIKQQLIKSGRVYACYETATELDIKRKMQLSRGLPPIYDRAALKTTEKDKVKFETEGRKPHYRFLLNDEPMSWHDEVRGDLRFESKNISDPIIIRENGAYTYMLPSTIDDIDMNITHIVRGEDHVTNTAIQIQMFKALGASIPGFTHLSLIQSKEAKISKREGGFEIRSLKEKGIEAMAINSFLSRIGTSDPVEARNSLREIIDHFDIKKFSRSPANYDIEELLRVNQKLLHIMPFSLVKSRLQDIDETFWNTIRPNLTTLKEAQEWHRICKETLSPLIDDGNFLKQTSELLPQGEWGTHTWDEWMNKVKETTGRKGKDLFMPIRKALTGQEHGPELKNLLPLIGKEKVKQRLLGQVA